MTEHDCIECGAPLETRAIERRMRVGRYTVEDTTMVAPVCTNGHVELSVDALAELERRAVMVVLSEAADIGGAEIRFARKAVGLTQVRLATTLDVAPETVSRWENASASSMPTSFWTAGRPLAASGPASAARSTCSPRPRPTPTASASRSTSSRSPSPGSSPSPRNIPTTGAKWTPGSTGRPRPARPSTPAR